MLFESGGKITFEEKIDFTKNFKKKMLEKDYSIVIAEKANFDDIIAINKVFSCWSEFDSK